MRRDQWEPALQGKRLITIDDANSSTGTGLERTGSLDWTKEANGRDWRMPDRLLRDRITAC